jgi:hypothetical protein
MWHVLERGEMHRRFGLENSRERDHLQDLQIYGRIILKWIVKNIMGRGVCTLDLPQRDFVKMVMNIGVK